MPDAASKTVRLLVALVVLAATTLAASACYEPVNLIFGTWEAEDGRVVSFRESGEVVASDGEVVEGRYKLDIRRVSMTVGVLDFEADEMVEYSITGFELTLSSTEGITVTLKRVK